MRFDDSDIEALLPLPEATFHILLALADADRQGYAILHDVASRTGGSPDSSDSPGRADSRRGPPERRRDRERTAMRFYRLLLRLYPRSFRAEYGEEMSHVFAERRIRASGPLAILMLWPETVLDVFAYALRVHGDLLRQDLGYAFRSHRRAPGRRLVFYAPKELVVRLERAETDRGAMWPREAFSRL